jgi:poly(A) polymerase
MTEKSAPKQNGSEMLVNNDDEHFDGEPKIVISETINPKHVDQDAVRIIRRLRRFGFLAYLVGGCVRDLLLDKQPKDFDVITSATPAEVHKLFSNSRIVGRRFRLVHVLFSAKVIEVSTFRNESTPGFFPPKKDNDEAEEAKSSDEAEQAGDDSAIAEVGSDSQKTSKNGTRSSGRESRGSSRRGDQKRLREQDADPSFYGEPSRDARRRDFSLNALFYDPDNRTIIDYVGGLDDIEKRVVRSISEANGSMAEDPVRTIRAIRFAAKLNFTIEPQTLDAIKRHGDKLSLCSQRRLFEEILKIMGGGHAAPTMRALHESTVLVHLLPEIASWIGKDVAEPVKPMVIEETIEILDSDDPTDVPIVHSELNKPEVEPDFDLKVRDSWDPPPFMIDAMVQTNWNSRPIEGSNEWYYDPDDDIHEDVYEAIAFQRDSILEDTDEDLGLTAERMKARAIVKLLKHNKLIEKRISDFVIDNLEAGRTRQLVDVLRRNNDDYVGIVSRGDRFLRYLTGLDMLYDMGVTFSTAFVLSVMFTPLLDDCPEGALLAQVDSTIKPMVERNCMSRRDRDQAKRLLALHFGQKVARQRRTRQRGKRRVRPTMTRRSQLNDAMLLKWLQCRVTGEGWPEFLHWEETVYSPQVGTRSVTHRVSAGLEDDWDR